MVEYESDMNFGSGGAVELDAIFTALSDATRRDMLGRIAKFRLTVSELAEPYDLTVAAVSKHLKVLEHAGFITKRKDGRKRYVYPATAGFKDAAEWMEFYRNFWEEQ
jgi:DNA-binding transcriptional ArsR family regulator